MIILYIFINLLTMNIITEKVHNITIFLTWLWRCNIIVTVILMIIGLEKLKDYNFYFTDINVIVQKPPYLILNVESRICNGFIYVEDGKCSWSWENGECVCSKGALVYLPQGSKHIFKIDSKDIKLYRLDFTLHINDEIALFSKSPLKIADNLASEAVEVLNSFYTGMGAQDDNIYKTEKICKFLRVIQKNVSAAQNKLMPAVRYIIEHFTENIDCHYLAELCYLSTSQFYSLFKKEFLVTPLEYKNNLILSRAINMLKYGDVSVKETAMVLGFLDDGYFCRFFKKHTGFTPKEYKLKF